jgi:hypothetical protein
VWRVSTQAGFSGQREESLPFVFWCSTGSGVTAVRVRPERHNPLTVTRTRVRPARALLPGQEISDGGQMTKDGSSKGKGS